MPYIFGHFGFSYVGLIFLLMLFIPNIIWTKHQPDGYDDYSKNENKILLMFERVGQVLTTTSALIFSDYNPRNFTLWTYLLIAAAVIMLLYEIAWVRYFRGGKDGKYSMYDFYKPLGFIPLPLATLPVAAFILLGIYGKVIWLVLSAIILGIGHIGIHAGHFKSLNK